MRSEVYRLGVTSYKGLRFMGAKGLRSSLERYAKVLQVCTGLNCGFYRVWQGVLELNIGAF